MVHPSYKSGTAIITGSDASIAIRGQLVDSDGKALGLIMGELKSNSQTIPIFSNRGGKFFIDGLIPGKYLLEFLDEHLAPITLDIKETQSGLNDLGNLVVRKK